MDSLGKPFLSIFPMFIVFNETERKIWSKVYLKVFPYEKVISVTLFEWFNAMQSENWVVIFCKGYEKQSQSVKGKL